MDDLRKKAEEIFNLKNNDWANSIDDVRKIMHDLQVYQIELELQNKELQEYSEKVKNAERKFYSLFNFSPIAYFLLDYKGVIEECNLKATELLDFGKDTLINKPMASYIAYGKINEFYNFLEFAEKSKQTQIAEFALFKKGKEIIITEIYASQIFERKIIASVIDISEKQIAEQHLKQALDRAEKSDRIKTTFLNSISHEIRTPLNSISGFSNLLKRTNLTPEKRDFYIERIEKSTYKLISIVEDILISSRIKVSDIQKNETVFSINQLLTEIKTLFDIKYKNGNINAELVLLHTDIQIISDREKLKNIFERLIENAVKFTEHGLVKFGAHEEIDKIVFHVKDNGIGIATTNPAELFNPFFKDNDQNIFQSGLGLGLTIAKGYIEILNGNIWFQPNPQGGSEFYFSIPYNKSKQILTTQTIEINSIIKLDKKTILIAEDEVLNFELLKEIFSEFDVNILYAPNGKIATEIFEINKVDIVLMDIKMPVMDGVEAAKIIRKSNKNCIILALTAYTNIQNQHEIHNLFNGFVTKPIDISKTLQTLNSLLNG